MWLMKPANAVLGNNVLQLRGATVSLPSVPCSIRPRFRPSLPNCFTRMMRSLTDVGRSACGCSHPGVLRVGAVTPFRVQPAQQGLLDPRLFSVLLEPRGRG